MLLNPNAVRQHDPRPDRVADVLHAAAVSPIAAFEVAVELAVHEYAVFVDLPGDRVALDVAQARDLAAQLRAERRPMGWASHHALSRRLVRAADSAEWLAAMRLAGSAA